MSDAADRARTDAPQLPDDALRDVKRAHKPFAFGRLALWTFTLAVAGGFAYSVARNPNFGWPVVAHYFFDPTVMRGLSVTLGLTVVAMTLGIVLGLPLAIARMSRDRLASSLSSLFIWLFRGTPLLVQLIFWYNMSILFPRISIGVASWDTNDLITPLTAAIIGLALNEAAYMAEIIRGALLSVDKGQAETAEAFGMTKARALRRIILPQAMKSIVPPTGNQLISMIKATSLVSVIAMADLLYSVQSIYNRTFEIIPLLLVAVLWYLLITSILNVGQSAIERYYSRGDRGARAAVSKTVDETAVESAYERA
jgi:polar amino acid transport system permease protein